MFALIALIIGAAVAPCDTQTYRKHDRITACDAAAPSCLTELADPDGFRSWALVPVDGRQWIVMSDRADIGADLKWHVRAADVFHGTPPRKEARPLCVAP
jgi:hypothetical protein